MGGFENFESWKKQFEQETQFAIGEVVQGQKQQIAVALMRELVARSPVDTGEFRQGWHMTSGAPSGKNTRTPDPVGDVLSQLGDTLAWAEVLFFQNNVPHARILEFGLFQPPNPGPSKDPRPGRKGRVLVRGGYSTQAPNGIIGDAVAAIANRFGLQKTESPDSED